MRGHKYRVGDRVIGIRAYDSNPKMVGLQGTVMREQMKDRWDRSVGVAFDADMDGHTGDGNWYRQPAHGRGWNVDPSYLRYLGRRVNPDKVDVGVTDYEGPTTPPPTVHFSIEIPTWFTEYMGRLGAGPIISVGMDTGTHDDEVIATATGLAMFDMSRVPTK